MSTTDLGGAGSLIVADDLFASLRKHEELALIDMRTPRLHGRGHIVGSVNLDLGRLASRAATLLPHHGAPIVLVDDGADVLAAQARAILADLGYLRVRTLAGGVDAWRRSGFDLHSGAALEMKAFGGWVRRTYHTPVITAEELWSRLDARGDVIVLDVRNEDEFRRGTLPGASHAPLGDVESRALSLVTSPHQTIVATCISLTRGVLAAQTLIDAGVPNPVYALEGGAMSWILAGGTLAPGQPQSPAEMSHTSPKDHGVEPMPVAVLAAESAGHSLWAFDVRASGSELMGIPKLSAGELIHSREAYFGATGGYVGLLDSGSFSRAASAARWLRAYGIVHPFVIDVAQARDLSALVRDRRSWMYERDDQDRTPALTDSCVPRSEGATLLDLSTSRDYLRAHPRGFAWASANRLLLEAASPERLLLTAPDVTDARQVAQALRRQGKEATYAPYTEEALAELGAPLTTNLPQFRHEIDDRPPGTFKDGRGNLHEMARYLDWELNLFNQLVDEPAIAFEGDSAGSPLLLHTTEAGAES